MKGRLESYSSLSTLASCARKYRLRYVDGVEPKGSSAPAHTGKALAAAFSVLYAVTWDYESARDALREAWGTFKPPIGSKHAWLTRAFAEERLKLYMEERADAPTQLETSEVLTDLVEQDRTFEWVNPEGDLVRLRGLMDLPIRIDGKLFVADTKCTTSWVSNHWAMKFRIGNQLRSYAAMLQNLTGEIVHGGLINAVYIGEKALDPPEKWEKRKSTPSQIIRIDFTQSQIAEAWEWARGLHEQRDLHMLTGRWPRNEMACGNYGGCEFLPLCTAPSKMAEEARKMTQFQRRTRV